MGLLPEGKKEAGLTDRSSTRAIGGSRSDSADLPAKPLVFWLSLAAVDCAHAARSCPVISVASVVVPSLDSATKAVPNPSASLPPSASALAG